MLQTAQLRDQEGGFASVVDTSLVQSPELMTVPSSSLLCRTLFTAGKQLLSASRGRALIVVGHLVEVDIRYSHLEASCVKFDLDGHL